MDEKSWKKDCLNGGSSPGSLSFCVVPAEQMEAFVEKELPVIQKNLGIDPQRCLSYAADGEKLFLQEGSTPGARKCIRYGELNRLLIDEGIHASGLIIRLFKGKFTQEEVRNLTAAIVAFRHYGVDNWCFHAVFVVDPEILAALTLHLSVIWDCAENLFIHETGKILCFRQKTLEDEPEAVPLCRYCGRELHPEDFPCSRAMESYLQECCPECFEYRFLPSVPQKGGKKE